MSSASIPGGTSLFTGFTKLCKGLAVVLVFGHIVVQILPSALSFLALIPARTIPFAWNLLTAGYIEQSIFGVVASTLCLLIMGKLLEAVWGSKEFLKFIFLINFLTSVCVFTTAIALYYISRQETYLYMPISGFQGVLAGFLVGMKQIIPDQELPTLRIKAKWFPSLTVILAVAISFFTPESATYLPTIIFGTYMSWVYLRYLQKRPESKHRGDPSQSLIPSQQYSTVCFVAKLKFPVKMMMILSEASHCLVLTPLRHLEGENGELEHWKKGWLRGWPMHGALKSLKKTTPQIMFDRLGVKPTMDPESRICS